MEADQIFGLIFKFGTVVLVAFGMFILKDFSATLKSIAKSVSSVKDSVNTLNIQIAKLIEKDLAKNQRLDFQEKQLVKLDIDNDYLRKGHIENSSEIKAIRETINKFAD